MKKKDIFLPPPFVEAAAQPWAPEPLSKLRGLGSKRSGGRPSQEITASPLPMALPSSGHAFPWLWTEPHVAKAYPPSYADLGKAPRDISAGRFGFGLVKLGVKTKSCSGLEFWTSVHWIQTLVRFVEQQRPNIDGMGLVSLSQKSQTWITLWGTEIAIEDQVYQGLKLILNTLSPSTSEW